MNVIIAFIRRNLHLIIFLALQLFCLFQITNNHFFHKASAFNTSSSITGYIFSVQSSISNYFNLSQQNKQLAKENSLLREQLLSSQMILDKRTLITQDTVLKNRYDYTIAEVINSSINRSNNFLTLNKGAIDGIKKGMAVIGPEGIIGIIYEVSPRFSLAMSVLNVDFKVSPFIPAVNFKEGNVSWTGDDPLNVNINGVNKFVQLKKGMMVVTSNYSPNFPPGIAIGTIETFSSPKNGSFYDVKVKLSTRFDQLQTAYIVKDIYRNEIDSLQLNALPK